MKKNSTLLLFILLSSTTLFAQEVSIAPFKNNASAAYSLIHDDFGARWAVGIENYADTMAFNRDIPICFAAITKDCDTKDWAKAKELIAHHHQIMNHSMSHKCGVTIDWCQAGNWDEHNFNIEIDSSTAWIERNTGKHPAFFIFPYDLFTDSMITYLQAKNYLGARAGKQNLTNSASQLAPFRLNYKMHRPEEPIDQLDAFAEKTILEKAWGIRVMHGIEDESWGALNHIDYGKHLDLIKKRANENKLWIANLSDVVTYQYMKEKYEPVIIKNNESGAVSKIGFKNNASVILPSENTIGDKTVTLILKQKNTAVKKVMQDKQELKFEVRNDEILINARPDKNDIIISY